MPTGFKQTSSLVRQLRWLVAAAACFFLFGFLGLFAASQRTLESLREINQIDSISALTSKATDALETAADGVQKLLTAKEPDDVRFAFHASQKIAAESLSGALASVGGSPEVMGHLHAAQSALNQYSAAIEGVFSRLESSTAPRAAEIRADLLAVGQFELDARDALRKAQLALQRESNLKFESVYRERHLPLVVAICLAITFFSIITVAGISMTRRIARSTGNLLMATDAVAGGDLSFRAPVLNRDEIGKLTHAFNQMVSALEVGQNDIRSSADRSKRLRAIAAALSEAAKPEEVAEVALSHCFEAVKASAGSIFLVNKERTSLELIKTEGVSREVMKEWGKIPIGAELPASESFRTARPLLFESTAELTARYPDVNTEIIRSSRAYASIPLTVEGITLGTMALRFSEEHRFSEEEREFLLLIARLCAQAFRRAQLYDDAQAAVRARDDFLSIASHELRTPLTSLRLQLQMLVRNIRSGVENLPQDRLLKLADTSDKQLGRLTILINDLLDVSRINAGKLTLNREEVDLSELVREVVERYQPQLSRSGCEVSIEAEPGAVGAFDRLRIEQVLVNLLTNACKYAPERPIRVFVSRSGDHASVSVQDHGPGIALENQRRIFERFEQVQSRDSVGGLGLGLFISRQIVTAHGGTLSVTSDLGRGSVFTVELPLRAQAGAPVSEENAADG